ncbi:MAG: phosphoribosylglycinamide formyltransferase [Armatimonadetes bacterium]|nr:phosphoribosylglycinamide formyltransferase [Armatimonadota bacterium]
MRLAVLVGGKGRGSNMKAILHACKTGRIPSEGALVIAPKDDIPAVGIAREYGAEIAILSPKEQHFAADLVAILAAERIDLLCLAGFLKLLPVEVLQAMPDSILNIHPALLPKFGGKGMYGVRVHEAVLRAEQLESGCTVHYVNEQFDEGAILWQMLCPVEPGDTPETLAARILPLEHECYVEAIRKWIADHGKAGRKASM